MRCWSGWLGAILVLGILISFPVDTKAQLYYPSQGSEHQVDAAQLWYNGYWKHPGWVNGTIVKYPCTDCRGKIHLYGNVLAPYEPIIRTSIEQGAIAVVVARNRPGVPGQGMYFIKGDQMDLNIPVVEVYQLSSDKHYIFDAIGHNGLDVSIWPMENHWKKANDKVGFQIFWNVLLSGAEITILLIGSWRLHQWTLPSCSRLRSIGPICIILEMISATLRFISTVGDPFFSFRVYPARLSMVMTTASVPFLLSSGILLTFFWAETLRANSIKAHPFIAEYKKSAAFVIFLLFAGEITTSTIRETVPVTGRFSSAYVSQAFYVIVSIVLVVCYLICTQQITNRLAGTGNTSKRKTKIRNMGIRFALSTSGYILFVVTLIASIPLLIYPWGWKVILNLMYLSLNIAGLFQVYSLQPVGSSKSSRSVSHSNPSTNTETSMTHSQTVNINDL